MKPEPCVAWAIFCSVPRMLSRTLNSSTVCIRCKSKPLSENHQAGVSRHSAEAHTRGKGGHFANTPVTDNLQDA